jgi:formylglycine-generating enzyme required for sulfatase activity
MKLAIIPPGEFEMGSPKELIEQELRLHGNEGWYGGHLPAESPQHRVRITKPYWLGVTEVTQEEYQRVMGGNPSKFQGDTKRPVEQVSWDDAVEFCRRLSELPGEKGAKRRYQLPTEAQWEHACRAGNPSPWSLSPQHGQLPEALEEKLLGDYGWFNANAGGQTHPVGQKWPSAWGLYDMHGNVEEWCRDWYDKDYYVKSPTDDPTGATGGGSGVVNRGGSYNDPAGGCRSASRRNLEPGVRYADLGFRACCVPVDAAAERATSPTSTTPPTVESPASNPEPSRPEPPKPVGNLLDAVDIARDRESGEWTREPDGLIGSANEAEVRLYVPGAAISGDYDLDVEFTRHRGRGNTVRIWVPVGEGNCAITLGISPEESAEVSAIEGIDGHFVFDRPNRNPTYTRFALANNHRYHASVKVRLEADRVSVEVVLDGKPHLSWKGQQKSFQYTIGKPRQLAVGGWGTNQEGPGPSITFHSVRLTPHDSVPTSTTTPTVGSDSSTAVPAGTNTHAPAGTQPSPFIGPDGKWNLPPGAPPPAVAPFDENKAKEHQAAWAKHIGVSVQMTNSIGMKLVLIPPGEFEMGSTKEFVEEELRLHGSDRLYRNPCLPGEAPRHRVRITKPYWLGVTEVTQEEYQRVMGSNPSKFRGDPKRPVEQVTWDQAVEFCRRLSESPGEKGAKRRYGLPTEAQWEYACRAGSAGRWYFSERSSSVPTASEERLLGEYGWFNANAGGQTRPVGQKRANVFGLSDMYGNVWEFCRDWYDKDYYAKSPTDDPMGPLVGSARVVRGGSWSNPAERCRSATRSSNEPRGRGRNAGFRVSLVPADK